MLNFHFTISAPSGAPAILYARMISLTYCGPKIKKNKKIKAEGQCREKRERRMVKWKEFLTKIAFNHPIAHNLP